jgi:hypothetical protein
VGADATGRVALGTLGLDGGGALLLKRALRQVAAGAGVRVEGTAPDLGVHLAAWCRAHALPCTAEAPGTWVVQRPPAGAAGPLWLEARPEAGGRFLVATGASDPARPDALAPRAAPTWGLAARGAAVEPGGPAFGFDLCERTGVWTDDAARLYAEAAAAQWDPATAIDWTAPCELPDEVEDAVVQVMTFLIENEHAALAVDARFVPRIHPHYREVVQLLAIQAADEARHVQVFTRRATLRGREPGLSTVGGQASLKTLLDEPDFATAQLLLAVLGEGTFLHLLAFIEAHAPDPVTAAVARLARPDEARHVAFGMAHLGELLAADPTRRGPLAAAIERRHRALQHTAGLNAEVFDALVLLAAGRFDAAAIATGQARVQALVAQMDGGRRARLERLGFATGDAAALAALHTRNFM